MSRDAEGVTFCGRSCSRRQPQPARQAISGTGGGGARGAPPMRPATGGGRGAAGKRREARPGLRLFVSAPPPPPPPPTRPQFLKHSENAGTSLVGIVSGARENDESPATSSSSSSALRCPTLIRVAAGAAATSCAQQTADASDHHRTILKKATRTRKTQNTTQRPTTTTARRTVRFDRCVRMVLVPALRDMDAAIVDGVWWGAEDVAEFRVAAAKHFFKHGGMRRMAQRNSVGDIGGDATPPEEVPDRPGGDDSAKPPISTTAAP
eukprot:g14535.t1